MDVNLFDFVQPFLATNGLPMYLILFFGAFFGSIIGFNLFLYGELFFLTGAILAGIGRLDIYPVFFICILGVILGDIINYSIGKYFGYKLFDKNNFLFNTKLYNKSKFLFDKFGEKSIFLAKIFGTFASVTPVLSGMFQIKFYRFFLYDFFGTLIGTGQFIILGYLLGFNYQRVFHLVQNYFIILFLLIGGIWLIFYAIKKTKLNYKIVKNKLQFFKFIVNNLFFYIFLVISFYIIMAYALFFMFIPTASQEFSGDILKDNHTIEELLSNYDLNVYYDFNKTNYGQNINVIYIGENVENLMQKIGWIKNYNFSDENMNLFKYIWLTINKIPPVSDQYFYGKIQDFAFQGVSDSLASRNHIRFWNVGKLAGTNKNIYLGAGSVDVKVTLKFYKYLFIPFHEVDNNTDLSRNEILQDFQMNIKNTATMLTYDNKKALENGIFTDGDILFLYD